MRNISFFPFRYVVGPATQESPDAALERWGKAAQGVGTKERVSIKRDSVNVAADRGILVSTLRHSAVPGRPLFWREK